MNEVTQTITPFETAALLKVLTGVLALIGTFISMGVVALFKMNAKLSSINEFNGIQKEKNRTFEKNHDELKARMLIIDHK